MAIMELYQQIFSLIGCFLLLFRLWLCEEKLKNELDFRRHFLSRFISYFVMACWMFGFENMSLNMIWVSVVPVLWIGFFLWDIRFYREIFGKNCPETWKEKKFWLILERLTLHPPIIIVGLLPFIFDFQHFVLGNGIVSSTDWVTKIVAVIFGNSAIISAFYFADVRAKDGSKTGKIIWIYVVAISAVMSPLCILAGLGFY